MSALGDEIVRATGGPTVNEGLALWFSKTGSESLGDAERRWLEEQKSAPAHINDMWYELLRLLTFTGTVNDMKLAYWSGIATGSRSVPNVVGLTQVDATAAIIAAGFILGTVTLTVDPVASQLPLAFTTAVAGSAINITMTS